MRTARRPDPEPLQTDERIPVGLGTALWAVAFVVLLILHDRLAADQRWWIWTCAAGTGGGLFGLWYIPYLKRKRGLPG